MYDEKGPHNVTCIGWTQLYIIKEYYKTGDFFLFLQTNCATAKHNL
jgi:hypothetical protein